MIFNRITCIVVITLWVGFFFPRFAVEAQDDLGVTTYEHVMATLETLSSSETIVVEIGTAKEEYSVGEVIEARFRVSQASYIVLMEISPEGQITFVIPNRRVLENKVEANRVYSTVQDFGLALKGTSAPGVEILNLFCSQEKIDLFDIESSEESEYYTVAFDDEERLQKLRARLERLKEHEWSGKSVIVQIVEPELKAAPAPMPDQLMAPAPSAPGEVYYMIIPRGALPSVTSTGAAGIFFPPIGTVGTSGKTE